MSAVSGSWGAARDPETIGVMSAVVAHDPQSGSTLFQASVLKTTELAGGKNMNSASNPNPLSDIRDGCPAP